MLLLGPRKDIEKILNKYLKRKEFYEEVLKELDESEIEAIKFTKNHIRMFNKIIDFCRRRLEK